MTAVLGDEGHEERSSATRRAPSAWRHRSDIQGLRAVAVGLVLAYHAGLPWVPAGYVGVDVFFVISGFLITGLLIKEVDEHGTVSLRRFYGRRVRRLLPAAGTVLLFVMVMTVLVLPETRWRSTVWDVVTSAFYVVNWRLAEQSVDYLAQGQAASPVQHFWSLAVEEQFYVIWPLLILGAVAVHRRFGVPLRIGLGTGLAVVAVPSLIWSAYLTAASPGTAYFVTTTRLWELAIGAALALTAGKFLRLPRSVVQLLGWGGLAMIAVFAVTATSQTPFPSLWALVPTLGAAAVLAAGIGRSDVAAGRLLSRRPLQDVGALSYSLYLWHWPVVVAGTALWGRDDGSLPWVTGLLLVTASALPAWLTYRVVEAPIHTSPAISRRPRLVLPVFGVSMLVPVMAAAGVYWTTVQTPPVRTAVGQLGAGALGSDPHESPAGRVPEELGTTVPSLAEAEGDNADVYELGCHQDQERSEPVSCTFGDPDSDVVLALVGDSHAAQWQPALREIAETRGLLLVTYTKSSCGFFGVDVTVGTPPTPYPSCSEWNDAVLAELTGPRAPDVVVATGNNSYSVDTAGGVVTGEAAGALLAESYAERWQVLLDDGVEVVALANTPWVGVQVPECLALNESDPGECAVPLREAMADSGRTQAEAAELVSGEHFLDLNEWICPGGVCSPVIGDVIVWRDEHHLTGTYARTLAPVLERHLLDAGVLR